MEALSFVYWLQGALELGQLRELNVEQVKIVQDHLNLVLQKKTPNYNVPSMPSQPIFRTQPATIGQPFDIGTVTC